MHPIIKQYCTLVEFLGQVLGKQYEIVLHDLSDNSNSIACIVNNHISGRTPGAPLTSLALQLIADRVYEKKDFVVDYRGISRSNSLLRSSTMFIKDDLGKLIGMLCINYDTSCYFQTLESLSELFRMSPMLGSGIDDLRQLVDLPHNNAEETFQNSVVEVVQSVLDGAVKQSGVPINRLTKDEKMSLVEILESKGVFLLKGAVSEVAKQMETSEATIYRYLNQINRVPKSNLTLIG